jgi:uncharacterized membrane protein YebE (DUF533 family)
MSFVRTLATLAVGFAAAKGFDKLQQSGGLKGLGAKMSDPTATQGVSRQVGQMLEKMGVQGGEQKVSQALSRMGGATIAGTDTATAGFGRLMAAMGGAAAAGATASAGMVDALTGADTTGAMELQAKMMIRAMIEAAKADGHIDDEEREKILSAIADAEPDERAWIEALMDSPPDMEGLVADTQAEMAAQVYAVSLSAITLDHASEMAYLRRLAAALGLSADQVAKIHGDA